MLVSSVITQVESSIFCQNTSNSVGSSVSSHSSSSSSDLSTKQSFYPHPLNSDNHFNQIKGHFEQTTIAPNLCDQVENFSNNVSNTNHFARNNIITASIVTPFSENQKSSAIIRNPDQIMNVDGPAHGANMMQSTRVSAEQAHYSLPSPSVKIEHNSSNMALNFTHDLSHQMGHQARNLADLGHNNPLSNQSDLKLHHQSSFDLDSGYLVSTNAVGMTVWKNTIGLNNFKHPITSEHSFLPPPTDLNSFTSWPHGPNFTHTTTNVTNHLLDSQHIVGYPPHQRSTLAIVEHDLAGCSTKNSGQTHIEQASSSSFMLNPTSNPQTSHDSSSNIHAVTQPIDNLTHLRPPHVDHQMQGTSYNLSINDNQLYNGNRSDNRSQHHNAPKTPFFMNDRLVMSLGNSHLSSQTSFPTVDNNNINQPITSHRASVTNVASSSSGQSKNQSNYKCNTCNEVFSLKTVYQSHLKQHSHGKGKYQDRYQCHYKRVII